MFVGVCLPPGLERGLEEDFLFALQLFSSVKESKGDAAAPQELVSTPENRKRTSEKIAAFLTNS
jgi:hypothetical protein